ncbi:hypothetical protein Tco_1040957 [Tanacetum coccineum]|uniref:Uncharacterized protein n=1 Tax=Tanacetum coccineum TaxID=301880 RepID=A0ABQ5GH01_9ASTR
MDSSPLGDEEATEPEKVIGVKTIDCEGGGVLEGVKPREGVVRADGVDGLAVVDERGGVLEGVKPREGVVWAYGGWMGLAVVIERLAR